jgi:hypothetical protein
MKNETSQDEQHKEKERRRRASAGHVNLPFSRLDEKHVAMVSTGRSLFIFTNYSTFEVLTPDKIDPNLEGTNIPWAVIRRFPEGSRQPIIARTILQIESAVGTVLIEQGSTSEIFKKALPITVALLECHSIFDSVKQEIKSQITDIEKNYDKLRAGPSAIVIPTAPTFDAGVRSFFGSAKRSITRMSGAIAELLDLKGHNRLDRINEKLLPQNDFEGQLIEIMKQQEQTAKYIIEARNAIEHPDKHKHFESRNFFLSPAREIVPPSWRVIHNGHDENWYDFLANGEVIIQNLTGLAEAGLLLSILRNKTVPFPFYVSYLQPEQRDPERPSAFAFSLQPFPQRKVLDQTQTQQTHRPE